MLSYHLVCTALDKNIYGNKIDYFEAKITDGNGNALANKSIYISYNNVIYSLISDSKGMVKLPVNINNYVIKKI